MRTQVLPEAATATAWLEHDPPGGSTQKTPLESFPFTIGRNDSLELHIDSSQVSREHAVITRQGRKYRVRDLGSTNGTYLNGQKIEEAMLCDGDLLVIADVEFTFYCGGGNARRQTATEVIAPSEREPRDAAWEAILAVRKTHETVTHASLRTLYQPVVQLDNRVVFGYEAFASDGTTADERCASLVPPVECRAAGRLRQLFRRLAVEKAAELPAGGRLFLAITAAETAEPGLVSHLCQLRGLVAGSRQLVVEIPDSAVRSTPDFRALLTCLRDVQIQVAYDGYASGKARITEHKDVAPDFLKLAASLFQSIRRGPDRQRQVQLIVEASQSAGCTVIATGIDAEADLQICRDLGCTLAQGNLFGAPQPITQLKPQPRAAAAPRPASR
jgi:EAL domain-containing protein (putative c-di-GMP-specific phosphodiesterase class I)